MKIKSPAFENFKEIPARYTCDGENVSPPLLFIDVPERAKSLALIVDDPDATRGLTWDHWLIWNIAPRVASLGENEAPKGAIEGTNSFGDAGYGGPCPPKGSKPHRFFSNSTPLKMRFILKAERKKQSSSARLTSLCLHMRRRSGFMRENDCLLLFFWQIV